MKMTTRELMLAAILGFVMIGDSRILEHPQNERVPLNSTIFLSCKVSIEADMQVIWMKGGFGLGETRDDVQNFMPQRRYGHPAYDLPNNLATGIYDLQISNVHIEDEEFYQCQQTTVNPPDTILSQKARLYVLVPSRDPELRQWFTDKSYPVNINSPAISDDGGTLQIECFALGGRPGAELVWYIDGVKLVVPDASGRVLGTLPGRVTFEKRIEEKMKLRVNVTNSYSNLTVNINKLHHGKEIECRALNEGYENYPHSKPARTRIEVRYPPEVTIRIEPEKRDLVYNEHDLVMFLCEAHGRPDNFFWEWYRNSTKIDNINDKTYRVRLTRQMDKASFRCTASNIHSGKAEITISVRYGPQFVYPDSRLYEASVGDRVTMECRVFSNPKSIVEWRRESSLEILHRGEIFTRDNLHASDFGTYICQANNTIFTSINKKMYIGQKGAPHIISESIVYARRGNHVRIRCVMEAIPAPKLDQVIWKKGGRPLPVDSNFVFSQHLSRVDSSLILSEVTSADFGDYNCTVSNGFGSDWKVITLAPVDKIPVPFIAGASVAILLTLVIVIIILFGCRQGFCIWHFCLVRKKKNSALATNGSSSIKTAEFDLDSSVGRAPVFGQWTPASCPVHSCNSSDKHSTNTFLRFGQDIDDRSLMRNGTIGHNFMHNEMYPFTHGSQHDKLVLQVSDDDLLKDDVFNAPPSHNQCNQYSQHVYCSYGLGGSQSPCTGGAVTPGSLFYQHHHPGVHSPTLSHVSSPPPHCYNNSLPHPHSHTTSPPYMMLLNGSGGVGGGGGGGSTGCRTPGSNSGHYSAGMVYYPAPYPPPMYGIGSTATAMDDHHLYHQQQQQRHPIAATPPHCYRSQSSFSGGGGQYNGIDQRTSESLCETFTTELSDVHHHQQQQQSAHHRLNPVSATNV